MDIVRVASDGFVWDEQSTHPDSNPGPNSATQSSKTLA